METLVQPIVRFGDFEVDARSGELRKSGRKIRLPEQSFQILALLLDRAGEVVTREELHQRLWPAGTFVDFDAGLNNAVRKLRDALADPAESPRYIETLPRRGYRFIAPVEAPPVETLEPTAARVPARRAGFRLRLPGAGTAVAALAAVLVALALGGTRDLWRGRSGPVTIASLAVLPFENLTGEDGQSYFVDGMTDALITNLAQVRSLRVISRTSVMPYKRTNKLAGKPVEGGRPVRRGDQTGPDIRAGLLRSIRHLSCLPAHAASSRGSRPRAAAGGRAQPALARHQYRAGAGLEARAVMTKRSRSSTRPWRWIRTSRGLMRRWRESTFGRGISPRRSR